jgi:hypothetical protein
MKRLLFGIIMATICLSMAAVIQAQQPGGTSGKPSKLPDEVCQAAIQYVAKIDSARSIKEKAKREEKYAEALDALATALKNYDKPSLLAKASEYAQCTESVASADPRDPTFDDSVAKRLQLRSVLLGMCEGFTLGR